MTNAQVDTTKKEPDIRCRVKYLELDEYGLMRHGSFTGIV
jgi:hypothetical protein